MNASDIIGNVTFENPYSCLKCIVPEAYIPVSWRILIILNLIFTALVYVLFVLEGTKKPSAQEILRFLRKPRTFQFVRLIVATCAFVSILVQPFTWGIWTWFQGVMILILGYLMFREAEFLGKSGDV